MIIDNMERVRRGVLFFLLGGGCMGCYFGLYDLVL